jgi:hypothetical protein
MTVISIDLKAAWYAFPASSGEIHPQVYDGFEN